MDNSQAIRDVLNIPTLSALLVLIGGCAGPLEPVIDESSPSEIVGGGAVAGGGTTEVDAETLYEATIVGALLTEETADRLKVRLEPRDLQRTATALEKNEPSERAAWINPTTGHELVVDPEGSRQRDGIRCRDFTFTVETDFGRETQQRTACRRPDGNWQVAG